MLGADRAQPLQCTDGVLRSLGQDLILGDECAVHIRQHEGEILRFSAIGLSGIAQSGRQTRPSRASSSSAAAGPVLPAA